MADLKLSKLALRIRRGHSSGKKIKSNNISIVANSLANDEPDFRRFGNLPLEIQSAIGIRAALDNPGGLVAGANTLSLVTGAQSNGLLADPMLKKVRSLAREGKAIAEEAYQTLYPRGGLPEIGTSLYGGVHRTEPISASEYIGLIIRPAWKYLSEASKAKTMQDVFAIRDPSVKLGCIRDFAVTDNKIEAKYGRPLVSAAVDIFGMESAGKPGGPMLDVPAHAILLMEQHIDDETLSKLKNILQKYVLHS